MPDHLFEIFPFEMPKGSVWFDQDSCIVHVSNLKFSFGMFYRLAHEPIGTALQVLEQDGVLYVDNIGPNHGHPTCFGEEDGKSYSFDFNSMSIHAHGIIYGIEALETFRFGSAFRIIHRDERDHLLTIQTITEQEIADFYARQAEYVRQSLAELDTDKT